MKMMMTLGLLATSTHAIATCPVDFGSDDHIDRVVEVIEGSTSCYQATQIANACAYGSSADVAIAGTATKICRVQATEIDQFAEKAYEIMTKRCQQKYAGRSGSLYVSAQAFCILNVAGAFASAYSVD